MFKVGMKVRPKDLAWCYTTYTVFIARHELYQYKYVCKAEPSTNKIYTLAYIAPHTAFRNALVGVLVDEGTKQCYLMALHDRALDIVVEDDKDVS